MLPSFENRKINIDKSFTKLCKVNKKYVYKNNNKTSKEKYVFMLQVEMCVMLLIYVHDVTVQKIVFEGSILYTI
jgi:hypothetical protein